MRRVRIALAAGLTLLAIAIGLTLAHAPMTVARSNRPSGQPEEPIATSRESSSFCQAGETLPRGTSALRIWLDAVYGPQVAVEVSAEGRRIAAGTHGSGWVGGSVTVPVPALARTVSGARVCVSFRAQDETVTVQGNSGRMWIEYLRPGSRSWASLVAPTARRMGLGRAGTGIWVVFVALALLATVIVLASRLLLRELS
jgi:hypothetical protein